MVQAPDEHNDKTHVMKRPKLISWMMVLGLMTLVLALAFSIFFKGKQSDNADASLLSAHNQRPRVVIQRIRPEKLEDVITLPGEIEPWEEVMVNAQVPGQVTAVLYEEGDWVNAGEVIVRIDPRNYENTLARIEAAYELAEKELGRQEALALKNVTAQASLDAMRSRFKDVAAQRQEAQLALSRTHISAPFAGTVHEIPVKKGSYVAVGDPIVTVLDIRRVKVAVGIPEREVVALRDLDTCQIRINALAGIEVTGKRIFLAKKPHEPSRVYLCKFEVPNPDGNLLPGMFAEVRLIRNIFNEAVLVPLYAVMNSGKETYVYTVNEHTVHRQGVQIGVLSDWRVQILKGLQPGDQVVVKGQRILEDGQQVIVDQSVSATGELN